MSTLRLYRKHPSTGQDSEEFMDEVLKTQSDADRELIAKDRRKGAKYYWHEVDDESNGHTLLGFALCEYLNIKFVTDMIGDTIEIV